MARSPMSGQSLQNWDPMKEAFEDPSFNTYREGPAANLDLDKQPCFSESSSQKRSGPCKLYVGKIPNHIDTIGIENMFRICGQPTAIHRNQSASSNNTWAFVTYDSYREAESAIREFNRKPPMNFIVEFARGSDADNVKIKKKVDSFEPQAEPQSVPVAPRKSLARNNGASGQGRGLAATPYVDPRIRDSCVPSDETSDTRYFQQYGGSNFDESNMTVMRGVQRINGPGGPRKFVNGRGTYDREMDELCKPQKLGNLIHNVHEVKNSVENYLQRTNGYYEYSMKEYPDGHVKTTCTLCNKDAFQFCARCKDWYCSRACQEKDWERHRKYCIPPLGTIKKMQFDDAGGNTDNLEPKSPPRVEGGRQNGCSQERDIYGKKDLYGNNQSKKISPSKLRLSEGNNFKSSRKDFDNNYNTRGRESANLSCDNGFDHDVNNAAFKGESVQNTKKSPRKFSSKDPKQKYDARDTSERSDLRRPSQIKERSREGRKEGGKNAEENSAFMVDAGNVSDQSSPRNNNKTPPKFSNKRKSEEVPSTLQTNDELSVPIYEQEQLSTSCFTKVKVQVPVAQNEYWVQLSSNFQEIFSMSVEMGKYKESAQVYPSVGMYCIAKYENEWYRAKITSVKPNIRVHFIDFGNEETSTAEKLKVLPDCLKHLKAQAIRIKLASGTSQKHQYMSEDAELSVKSVDETDTGLVIVHVEGESYGNSKKENPSTQEDEVMENCRDIALQNVTVLLAENTKCYLLVTECNDDEFVATLVPANMSDSYNELFRQEDCDRDISHFVPEVGEPVLAKFLSDGWVRGYVLHVSLKKECTVACCDTGIVETVKESNVRKLPRKLREIVQFAVQGRAINRAKKHIQESAKISVLIECITCDSAIAVLENEKECKLELKKWSVPYELYQDLKCIELKDGVCVVSAEMSAVEMYIRPCNVECIEIYNRLLQDVPKHCFNAPALKNDPKVGQVVAAEFSEDKTFYRALVHEVSPTKGIKVQYIDFGNVEYIQKESLRLLPKDLRDIVCCVVKVVLKDVEDRPLNDEVQNFFKDLTAAQIKLRVKLTDPNSNRVDLYTKDGTHVNEKINKMLIPGWKKGVTDNRVYNVENVLLEGLELNTTCDLEIKLVVKFNEIVVRWQKSKVINLLENDLQPAIDEYCLQTKEAYTPRHMELCLANVQNVWRRCVCVCAGNPLSLYQLDVGPVIEVSHSEIRRYRQEFTTLPAVAMFCKIKTKVHQTKNMEQYMRNYLLKMKVITAKIVEEIMTEAGLKGYVIEIPELDVYLQTL